ncbi:expressed unknown protein [Seminavis robusta]|uniref:Uncharacterized protein n=1 Tax=Seminavis robusta TaxID=568900 RepID=A0A9N8EP82_9STRA|nr:expressed unknown protein [Seminavis robusta]|eukprot:Sro1437_g272590.1 n/a (386) ;mRNA; f:23208-24365
MGFGMMKTVDTAEDGSSTAAHYTANYETITAGVEADKFYGIPLKLDITDAPEETLMYLGLLLLWVLVFQPRLKFLQGPLMGTAFWMAIVTAAWAIKEVTVYPIVSAVIFTRTQYPWPLVVCHCITANAAYRKERGPTCNYLESFILGFFCYGFGGTIVSDVLMGLPITAFGHSRIVPVWIVGWILIWFCPFDAVYKICEKKNSSLYYFISAMVAIDAVTTPFGRVSRSARELKNKLTAPIMAGLMSGIGGAGVRYVEKVIFRGGGERVQRSCKDAIEAGFWRTLGYSVLWWFIAVYRCENGSYGDNAANHCHEYNGHNMDRFVITVLHVAWNFACDLGLAWGHPFVFLAALLRSMGSHLAYNLGYGPPQLHGPDLYMTGVHQKMD